MTHVGATGLYQLYRQVSGLGYFGKVQVELASRPAGGPRKIWSLDRHGDDYTQPGERLPDFADAVREGVEHGTRLVSSCGVDVRSIAVVITGAWYRYVDGEITATRAAAALAVVEAFGMTGRVGLDFDEDGGEFFGSSPTLDRPVGRWTVRLVLGVEGFGPLTASTVCGPKVVQLSSAMGRAAENGTWVIDDCDGDTRR